MERTYCAAAMMIETEKKNIKKQTSFIFKVKQRKGSIILSHKTISGYS